MQAASESVTNLALMPQWLDPMYLLNEKFAGVTMVALLTVIFIETGLLFPLLPGDSLLFTAGLLTAQPHPFAPLWLVLILVPIAAILGDQVGYLIGNKVGTALFTKDSRFFKKEYIDEAHAFFEKYGPITIILARFVPIVRTFAPVVAGASKMRYSVFLTYNIIGGVLWGAGVTVLGYFLGNISFVRDNIEPIFLLIVFVSVLPMVLEAAKRVLASRRTAKTVPTDGEPVIVPHDPAA